MSRSNLPTNESSFFQLLKNETLSSIFWERLELKSDSGFPDSHFVLRKVPTYPCEGTIEFKFQRDNEKYPDLRKLMRGEQKANFLDYFAAGGRRRWLLSCNKQGVVHLYTARVVCEILKNQRKDDMPFSSADFFDPSLPVRTWLPMMLEM